MTLSIDNRVNEGDRKLLFVELLFPLSLYCSLAMEPTCPLLCSCKIQKIGCLGLQFQLSQPNNSFIIIIICHDGILYTGLFW